MGYLSRLPNSNEPYEVKECKPISISEVDYGPQPPLDNFSALLNGLARRCIECKKVTMNQYYQKGLCPKCRYTTTLISRKPPECSE